MYHFVMNGSDIHIECIFGHYDVTVAMYHNEHLSSYFQGTNQVQPIMFMMSESFTLSLWEHGHR